MKDKRFVNLGTRNKATLWEYGSAYSFLFSRLPGTNFRIPLFLSVGEGMPNMHCHHLEVIKSQNQQTIREFEAGKMGSRFFQTLRNYYWRDMKIINRINKTDFTKDNNAVLAKKFKRIFVALLSGHTPMLMALYTTHLDVLFTRHLEAALAASGNKNLKPAVARSLLLTTPRKSFDQKEEQAIFELQRSFFRIKGPKDKTGFDRFCARADTREKFKSLARNYGWFHMEYSQAPWSMQDYIDYVWERSENVSLLSQLKDPNSSHARIIKRQKELLASIKGQLYFKKLVKFFQEFSFILDDSKVYTVKAIYRARPLFEEAGRRMGLNWNELLYFTLPEIIDLLEKNRKADKRKMIFRQKFRSVLLKDGKITTYEGAAVKKIKNLYLFEDKNDSTSIKGIIAYPGLVRGKATVINSIKDKTKFKIGDILVTHDGTAELTYFLREASAIVTNEGGMICHAAIVAREMKTPCIVGTRNATKMIKDGDIIEVDANQGKVVIIQK